MGNGLNQTFMCHNHIEVVYRFLKRPSSKGNYQTYDAEKLKVLVFGATTQRGVGLFSMVSYIY